jgi:hypothetical protein
MLVSKGAYKTSSKSVSKRNQSTKRDSTFPVIRVPGVLQSKRQNVPLCAKHGYKTMMHSNRS